MDRLNYGRMMQKAMRGLVAEVLALVAERGLPGEHHFYITFRTTHPGVSMPYWLKERFSEEMVIVLQHMFYDLTVEEERFSVTLTFNDRPATLSVPFEAVLQFADPSAEFGLRFDSPDEDDDGEPLLDDEVASALADRLRRASTEPRDDEEAPGEDGAKRGEVVQLDTFRKK